MARRGRLAAIAWAWIAIGALGVGCTKQPPEPVAGSGMAPRKRPLPPVRRVAARPSPPMARRATDPDPPASVLPVRLRRIAGDEGRLKAGKLLSYPSRWSRTVYVEQKGSVRYLYLGRRDVIQTRMDMKRPGKPLSPYLQCMLVALGFFADPQKELRRVAMIGLGGGAATRFFQARWPQLRFHSVDIDPVVVAVARHFFGVRDTATYRSYVADGRRFLRDAKIPYDLIVLDAFDASANVPKQLVSLEFFRLIRKRLSAGGVLAINFLIHSRKVYSAVVRTVRAVFPAVARFPLSRLDTYNALLVAPRDAARRPTPAVLKDRVLRLGKGLGLSFSVARCVQTLDSDKLLDPKGPLLRDPKPAP